MECLLAGLPGPFVDALAWFEANAGRVFAERPFDVGLGIKVTELRKGIRKPAGVPYALSVVQTPNGSYPDEDPLFETGGMWSYAYHQQGSTAEDLRDPSRKYANVALFRNQLDGVPVGVVVPDPGGYRVLGLAQVERYDRGLFTLSGPVSIETPASAPPGPITIALVDFTPDAFDPASLADAREKTIAQVVRRQGQPHFRRMLLRAYEGRCAMSSYDAESALEAAHIMPYRGAQTNHPANGLLLRGDIHDLFDLGLIAVDGSTRMQLAGALEGTMYEPLHGQPLRMPRDVALRPSEEALGLHYARSAVV
ncbi:MAG TPA: HNH endonuclease [Coriobacteriia bacterium]